MSLKPYWSQELQELWNLKVKSERAWLKENGPNKRHLKSNFCSNRKRFDQALKKAKRK